MRWFCLSFWIPHELLCSIFFFFLRKEPPHRFSGNQAWLGRKPHIVQWFPVSSYPFSSWISHDVPIPHDVPMSFPWWSWCSHGFPMVFPRFSNVFPHFNGRFRRHSSKKATFFSRTFRGSVSDLHLRRCFKQQAGGKQKTGGQFWCVSSMNNHE